MLRDARVDPVTDAHAVELRDSDVDAVPLGHGEELRELCCDAEALEHTLNVRVRCADDDKLTEEDTLRELRGDTERLTLDVAVVDTRAVVVPVDDVQCAVVGDDIAAALTRLLMLTDDVALAVSDACVDAEGRGVALGDRDAAAEADGDDDVEIVRFDDDVAVLLATGAPVADVLEEPVEDKDGGGVALAVAEWPPEVVAVEDAQRVAVAGPVGDSDVRGEADTRDDTDGERLGLADTDALVVTLDEGERDGKGDEDDVDDMVVVREPEFDTVAVTVADVESDASRLPLPEQVTDDDAVVVILCDGERVNDGDAVEVDVSVLERDPSGDGDSALDWVGAREAVADAVATDDGAAEPLGHGLVDGDAVEVTVGSTVAGAVGPAESEDVAVETADTDDAADSELMEETVAVPQLVALELDDRVEVGVKFALAVASSVALNVCTGEAVGVSDG